jgi:hypothetical protein
MTLDEAIAVAEDIAAKNGPAAARHLQLVAWLKELQFLRFWQDHAYAVLKDDVEWAFPMEVEGKHVNACPTCFNSAEEGHAPDCSLGVLVNRGWGDKKTRPD